MNEQTIPNVTRGSIIALLVIWGFAAFWNGFVAVMLYMFRHGTNEPSPTLFYAIASPFILAGLFLVGLAATLTLRLIRYRSLVLHLDTMPGVVGGRVAGTIHGAAGALRQGMTLALTSRRRSQSNDGLEEITWDDVIDLPAGSMMRTPMGATVPFRFDVPYECQPTDDDDGRIYWQVTVQTEAGAYAATFTVPVARTAQSSPEITEKSLRPRTIAQPQYSKVRLERTIEGAVELRFPQPSWVWKWYLFTFLIGAAAVAVARQVIPDYLRDGMPQSWAVGVYALIGAVVLFLLALIQLGLYFSPRVLRIDRDELRVRFASPLRGAKVLAASSVADFVPKLAGSGHRYDVDVQRTDGSVYPWLMIAGADKREAEWLAYEMRRALARG